jgi:hypothetical protein
MNIDIQTRRFRLLDWIKFISTFLKVDSHGNLTNLLCVGFEAFEAAANLTASEFTTTYNASVVLDWSVLQKQCFQSALGFILVALLLTILGLAPGQRVSP